MNKYETLNSTESTQKRQSTDAASNTCITLLITRYNCALYPGSLGSIIS